MKTSWLGRIKSGRHNGLDRRAVPVPESYALAPEDFDPRTGALKWGRLLSILEAERATKQGALLMVDLSEHSRRLLAKDENAAADVLPLLLDALRQAIRSDDLIAHRDGYCFAVLLRGASEAAGREVGERILRSVEDTIFLTSGGIVTVNVAVGGALFQHGHEDLVADAEAKLMAAVASEKSAVAF